ncbi:hypothetical protein AgCh_029080 [Apium graveolens]
MEGHLTERKKIKGKEEEEEEEEEEERDGSMDATIIDAVQSELGLSLGTGFRHSAKGPVNSGDVLKSIIWSGDSTVEPMYWAEPASGERQV